MVNNMPCELCAFQAKCVAKNKLKPFTDEARTDLGVELTFVNCVDFTAIDDADEETPDLNELVDATEEE